MSRVPSWIMIQHMINSLGLLLARIKFSNTMEVKTSCHPEWWANVTQYSFTHILSRVNISLRLIKHLIYAIHGTGHLLFYCWTRHLPANIQLTIVDCILISFLRHWIVGTSSGRCACRRSLGVFASSSYPSYQRPDPCSKDFSATTRVGPVLFPSSDCSAVPP